MYNKKIAYLCTAFRKKCWKIESKTPKKYQKTMKTTMTFKTILFAVLVFVCGINAMADNSSNLIYNSEEVNGLKVAETVYKQDNGTLSNYMQYNYKYDNQNRMIESQAQKWNGMEWKNDMCIRYAYQGKSITTTYYKWNSRKGEYVLVPEMTITMDNPNL